LRAERAGVEAARAALHLHGGAVPLELRRQVRWTISSAPSVVDQRTAGALAGARLTGAKLAHEIGHHLLQLADVEVAGNFMFNGQGPDTPPRYKRLAHRYHPADGEPPRERQWNARRKPSGR
jgi:hypothetical protein